MMAKMTYFDDVCRRAYGRRYCTCSEARSVMAVDIVVEVSGFQQLGLEVIIPGMAIIHNFIFQQVGVLTKRVEKHS